MRKYFILLLFLWAALGSPLCIKAQSQSNTILGRNASKDSKGIGTVYIGMEAGQEDNQSANIVSSENAFVGVFAGYTNVGIRNTFNGGRAGQSNNGQHNTFTGWMSGFSNKGDKNTFMGMEAGRENVGINNVALGHISGQANKGNFNAFGGVRSGFQNVGNRNTAFGYSAGSSNLGASNTFLGTEAGGGNNGNFNIGIGERAGFGNDGHYNIAIGYQAGISHSNASNNTYLGAQAGEQNKIGNNNVFLGFQSGRNETGSNKFYLANGSNNNNVLLYGDFQKRKLVVGGKVDSDYTLHVLGNVFSTGTWTSSDKRFKQNIQSIDKPLEKLLAVKGVSYEFKKDSVRAFHAGKSYGFIAQDVQKVFPALVQADKQGYLAVNYECFIPLLVEALKQQETTHQQKVTKLEAELAELRKLVINNLRVKAADNSSSGNQPKTIVLHQNTPNPFNQTTTIRYEVPATGKQIALYVYDSNGQPQLQLNNLNAGKGEATIQAGQLQPGMYLYSLLVDGKTWIPNA